MSSPDKKDPTKKSCNKNVNRTETQRLFVDVGLSFRSSSTTNPLSIRLWVSSSRPISLITSVSSRHHHHPPPGGLGYEGMWWQEREDRCVPRNVDYLNCLAGTKDSRSSATSQGDNKIRGINTTWQLWTIYKSTRSPLFGGIDSFECGNKMMMHVANGDQDPLISFTNPTRGVLRGKYPVVFSSNGTRVLLSLPVSLDRICNLSSQDIYV